MTLLSEVRMRKKKQNRFIYFLFFLTTLLFFDFSSARAEQTVCLIPGLNGATEFFMEEVPNEMKLRGFNFVSLEVVSNGTLQDHVKILVKLISAKLQLNPEFHCSLVLAHSMGGLIIRSAMKQPVHHPFYDYFLLSNVVDHIVTVGTPHYGTPVFEQLHFSPASAQMTPLAMQNTLSNPQSPYYAPSMRKKYSYVGTYMSSVFGSSIPIEQWGFQFLLGMQLVSDGIVPLESQRFGVEIETLNVRHTWLNDPSPAERPEVLDYFEYLANLF